MEDRFAITVIGQIVEMRKAAIQQKVAACVRLHQNGQLFHSGAEHDPGDLRVRHDPFDLQQSLESQLGFIFPFHLRFGCVIGQKNTAIRQ